MDPKCYVVSMFPEVGDEDTLHIWGNASFWTKSVISLVPELKQEQNTGLCVNLDLSGLWLKTLGAYLNRQVEVRRLQVI